MTTFLDDSVAQALVATRIVGRKNSYAADNPNESSAVFAYLKGGMRPTSVATALGKHLVSLEDARRAGYGPPTNTGGTDPAAYSVEAYNSGDYNK
jgi:hypothetical protein